MRDDAVWTAMEKKQAGKCKKRNRGAVHCPPTVVGVPMPPPPRPPEQQQQVCTRPPDASVPGFGLRTDGPQPPAAKPPSRTCVRWRAVGQGLGQGPPHTANVGRPNWVWIKAASSVLPRARLELRQRAQGLPLRLAVRLRSKVVALVAIRSGPHAVGVTARRSDIRIRHLAQGNGGRPHHGTARRVRKLCAVPGRHGVPQTWGQRTGPSQHDEAGIVYRRHRRAGGRKGKGARATTQNSGRPPRSICTSKGCGVGGVWRSPSDYHLAALAWLVGSSGTSSRACTRWPRSKADAPEQTSKWSAASESRSALVHSQRKPVFSGAPFVVFWTVCATANRLSPKQNPFALQKQACPGANWCAAAPSRLAEEHRQFTLMRHEGKSVSSLRKLVALVPPGRKTGSEAEPEASLAQGWARTRDEIESSHHRPHRLCTRRKETTTNKRSKHAPSFSQTGGLLLDFHQIITSKAQHP